MVPVLTLVSGCLSVNLSLCLTSSEAFVIYLTRLVPQCPLLSSECVSSLHVRLLFRGFNELTLGSEDNEARVVILVVLS
jgi:hypothetical protein